MARGTRERYPKNAVLARHAKESRERKMITGRAMV
jgi:hypothetical protein